MLCVKSQYSHAKFGCHSLNAFRDMAITVQVEHLSSVILSEEQGHRTENRLNRPLVGLSS